MTLSLFGRALVVAAFISCGVVPSGPVAAAADQQVDAVLRASRSALHLDALAKVRTLHLRGPINVVGFAGSGEAWQDVRTGTFAQPYDAGPLSGSQGFDGEHAWNQDAKGFVWNDDGRAGHYGALEAAYINRYALWMPDHGGATVASAGEKTDGGHRYDVLRVTPSGALPFDVWIDATTHLPVRTIAKIGTTTSTTVLGDYRSVGGLMVPFSSTTEGDGNLTTFKATSASYNDPGAAAALRRPAAHVDDFSLPGGTTTIPFESVDGHVALPVTIDGKGPFTFIFDTGGANLIDTEVAKQLGLGAAGNAAGNGVGSNTEAVQFATVDSLQVGGATLRKQTFIVVPVRAGFGMGSGKPVDGLIGFEVLARFVTTFDYGTNTIVLRSHGSAIPAGTMIPPGTTIPPTTIPFLFDGNKVDIPCTIATFDGRCTIDTGSRSSLSVLSPFIAAHPTIAPANATAVGANGFGLGGASLGRLGRTTLQIAGFTLPDLVTDLSTQTQGAFADPFTAGNIGAGVLSRFAVTFDYTHQLMSLVPNANFSAHETYDRSGLFLINQGGKVLIADVRPGTPAAAAGLVRGEALGSVGGKDAATLGLAALRGLFRGAPGTAIPLTVSGKDGTTRTVTITLRDYV